MKRSLLYIGLVMTIMVILPFSVFGNVGDGEMDITVMPKDTLFDIDDLKPGDWAPRTIEVQNSGTMDFQYSVFLENRGEQKLFNEMLFEISDDEDTLYNGKLADFEQLPIRELASKKDEKLQMTIHFTEHLGNEFQGLDIHFSLIFTTEEKLGKTSEVIIDSKVGSEDMQQRNSMLPKTATNLFTFMLVGIALFICGGILFMHTKRTKKISEKLLKNYMK